MKKLLLVLIVIIFISSCVEQENKYNENMETLKEIILEVNNYFENHNLKEIDISEYYTEDFVFYSYPAGKKKGIKTSKIDYIKNLKQMKQRGISLNIGHSIYLPGINKDSYDLDGSVRVYYGATISTDIKSVDFSGYQTIDFENGRISGIWEWADYGGVNNQLSKKSLRNL
jgi:hypothetical protein